MPEYTIQSISEYVEKICEIDAGLIRNGAEKHEVLLFRGQGDADFDLIPSIGRNRLYSAQSTIFTEERNLIELAKFKRPDIFSNDLQPIELLSLLQHHGIPTRLLDITENALVALYFACASEPNSDGEVIVFVNNELSVNNYPTVNAIADSYRFTTGGENALSDFLYAAMEQPYFLEQKYLLSEFYDNPTNAANWVELCCKKRHFIHAPIKRLRQQLQQGRYILFPNRIEELSTTCKRFSAIIDPIPKDDKCIAASIVIPQQKKEAMLSALKSFGISRGKLFGDSIDVVCKEIVDICQYRIKGDPGSNCYCD